MRRSYRDGQDLHVGNCSCHPQPEPYCDHGPFDACRCLASEPDVMEAAKKAYEAQRVEDRMHTRGE